MDGTDLNFPERLLQILDTRRSAISDRAFRDVPKSEVASRGEVLETLLRNLREPNRIPDDLKSRDSTLKILDRWMAPLKKNGYDNRQH